MTGPPQKKQVTQKVKVTKYRLKNIPILTQIVSSFLKSTLILKLFAVYSPKMRNINYTVPTKIAFSFAMLLKLAYPSTEGTGLL